MNQPPQEPTSRSARPQLFAAPSTAKRHQADFGPSILSTIDGRQARYATSSDRFSSRKWLWAGMLMLVLAAAYAGARFGMGAPAEGPASVVASKSVAPTPVAAAVLPLPEPAASAAPSPASGVASIETVAATASAASQPQVVAGANSIQKALEQPEPVPQPAARPAAPAVKPAPAGPVTRSAKVDSATSASKSVTPKTGAIDNDAALLAAMLPHLSRTRAASSPEYEKRCGSLTGDAAAECRVRFCTGRQGTDTACQPPAQGSR